MSADALPTLESQLFAVPEPALPEPAAPEAAARHQSHLRTPEPSEALYPRTALPSSRPLPPVLHAHPTRVIAFHDGRLTQATMQRSANFATAADYARAAGMPILEVLAEFAPWVDRGVVALELVGDHIFVHTAPRGRPPAPGDVDVPANLWERLRARLAPDAARHEYERIRALEEAGWRVETAAAPVDIPTVASARPHSAVWVQDMIVPILPTAQDTSLTELRDALVGPSGLLEAWERAGIDAAGLLTPRGGLDPITAIVRRWMLARTETPSMHVMLLEAPGYGQPVFLGPNDGGVHAASTLIPIATPQAELPAV